MAGYTKGLEAQLGIRAKQTDQISNLGKSAAAAFTTAESILKSWDALKVRRKVGEAKLGDDLTMSRGDTARTGEGIAYLPETDAEYKLLQERGVGIKVLESEEPMDVPTSDDASLRRRPELMSLPTFSDAFSPLETA